MNAASGGGRRAVPVRMSGVPGHGNLKCILLGNGAQDVQLAQYRVWRESGSLDQTDLGVILGELRSNAEIDLNDARLADPTDPRSPANQAF
jgi:hypothetical protein